MSKYKRLELELPLKIEMGHYVKGEKKDLPKKPFSMNMNIYRNSNHYILNAAKTNWKALLKKKLKHKKVKFEDKVFIIYKYTSGSKRRSDLLNWISIVDKYTLDTLVELGVLVDDSYYYIPCLLYTSPSPRD